MTQALPIQQPAQGLLVGLGLSLVSDTSGRPGHQEVMLFRTKKQFFSDFRNCQHIFDKNGPMKLDADEPRKFQGPPDRILGPADMGGGGGGGGGPKSEDSLWRRDLSALGPFGAEANCLLVFTGEGYFSGNHMPVGQHQWDPILVGEFTTPC